MISDEAVEAAAKAILSGMDERHHAYKIAYAALEAAAPYMVADAWEAGADAYYSQLSKVSFGFDFIPNPYRSQA